MPESGKNLMYTFLFLVCFGMHVINSFSCSDDCVLIDGEFDTPIGKIFLIRIICSFQYSTIV